MSSAALDALAKELAPRIARELGLEPSPHRRSSRFSNEYDEETCREFVSPLHIGDTVLDRAEIFFSALADEGEIGSLALVDRLGLKGPTAIPANLTNALKKSANRMGLDRPWVERVSGDNRTIWADRHGVARRMLRVIREEQARRAR